MWATHGLCHQCPVLPWPHESSQGWCGQERVSWVPIQFYFWSLKFDTILRVVLFFELFLYSHTMGRPLLAHGRTKTSDGASLARPQWAPAAQRRRRAHALGTCGSAWPRSTATPAGPRSSPLSPHPLFPPPLSPRTAPPPSPFHCLILFILLGFAFLLCGQKCHSPSA